jgi:hypothetical protein
VNTKYEQVCSHLIARAYSDLSLGGSDSNHVSP